MRTPQATLTALVLALATVVGSAAAHAGAPLPRAVVAPPAEPAPVVVEAPAPPAPPVAEAALQSAPVAAAPTPEPAAVPVATPAPVVTAAPAAAPEPALIPAAARPVRGHLEATIDARRRVVLAFFDESGSLRWRAVAWVSDPSAMLGTLSMLAGDSAQPDDEDTEVAEPAPASVVAAPASVPAVVAPNAVVAPATVITAPAPRAEPAQSVHIGVATHAAAVRVAL